MLGSSQLFEQRWTKSDVSDDRTIQFLYSIFHEITIDSAPHANQRLWLNRADADAGVKYRCAGFVDEEWIAFKFRVLWEIFNHRAHTQ
jgi:hypothetical protein